VITSTRRGDNLLSILDYRQPVEFRIDDVIVRSWTILSRHFLTFVFLVGIAQLLPLLLKVTGLVNQTAPDMSTILTAGAIGLLSFILSTFAQAIVIYAAFQDLRGQPVNAMESVRQGFSRVIPVIFASIFMGIVVGLGFLLFVIPGLIALAALAVVVPACVVERLGPMESISRSRDLTTGHRWPILGVGVAWLVIGFMVVGSVQAALPANPPLPRELVQWIWQVLAGSFTSVYAAILYHDLRAVREGIGIDEIASVFD
jgi:hypothetical protein